jgi:hypothetical protein
MYQVNSTPIFTTVFFSFAGKGIQDNQFSSESFDKLESKVSKYYDTTQQYR